MTRAMGELVLHGERFAALHGCILRRTATSSEIGPGVTAASLESFEADFRREGKIG